MLHEAAPTEASTTTVNPGVAPEMLKGIVAPPPAFVIPVSVDVTVL